MESGKKPHAVALNPIPIPIKRFSNDKGPVWPTDQGVFVSFQGKLDPSTRCVVIDDFHSSDMLTRMGSFGQPVGCPQTFILDLIEAYFLSYAIGCLTVMENDKIFNLDELWIRFRHLQANFAAVYAVYHLYRSKGWVVRRGSQLGTTFTLYKEGPEFNHAHYAVDVNIASGEANSFNNWQSLMAKHRVVNSVSKNLLIANVMFDKELDLLSPKCIKNFKITTNLVSRWRCQP